MIPAFAAATETRASSAAAPALTRKPSAATFPNAGPSRITTPGTPPSRTMTLTAAPRTVTGMIGSSWPRKSERSCSSLGRNRASAAPTRNQVKGASCSLARSLPRRTEVGR